MSNPSPSRHVVIDGAGFIEQPWMAVIVLAQTGVTYENQTGGFACLPRQAEGYYVPVFNGSAFQSLRFVFEVELGGSGTHRYDRLPKELLEVLRQAVADIRMDTSIGREGAVPLQLDESQIDQIDEAWIPVITPDGAGVLTWENSD